MLPGGGNKLPYGNIPRLLLAWLCTEAVQTRDRNIVLGRSLSQFMQKLDLHYDGGGPRGIRTLLRNQMNRLFHTQISLFYDHAQGRASISSLIADRTDLWWDPKRPDQSALFDSTIRLGENFFEEIIQHPVPINMNILSALKRSSLGLDLYLWLLYRTFTLRQPLTLSWRQLYRQFGAEPDQAANKFTVRNFRADCLRELKKIHFAWPALNFTTPRGALEIRPCLEDPAAKPLALFPSTPLFASPPPNPIKHHHFRPHKQLNFGCDFREFSTMKHHHFRLMKHHHFSDETPSLGPMKRHHTHTRSFSIT